MDKRARAFTRIAWFVVLYGVWSFFSSSILPNIDIRLVHSHSPAAFEHLTPALADYFLLQRIVGATFRYALGISLAVFAWNLRADFESRLKARMAAVLPAESL